MQHLTNKKDLHCLIKCCSGSHIYLLIASLTKKTLFYYPNFKDVYNALLLIAYNYHVSLP